MVIALLLAMSFVSCDKGLAIEMEIEGKVSFRDFEAIIKNAEEVIESRADANDLSQYIVEIVNNGTGEKVNTWTYSTLPEILSLPVGDYRVKVYNAELQDVAWESPYFYGEESFTVKENDLTEVGAIVCKLSNLKVSVQYSDELKSAIGTGEDVKVNVLVGDGNSLDFAYGENRAGYFRCDAENKSLVATFSGTVEGYYISEYKVISDVCAGQHRIISFSLKSAPDVSDEYGTIGSTGLSMNASVTSVDLTRDVPVEEETIQPDDFLNVSEDILNYQSTALSKNIIVNASASWTASSNENWCTISPIIGNVGESSLTITVAENVIEQERNAVVTIIMGDVIKEVLVKQAAYSNSPAVDAPLITSSTINLNAVNVVTASTIVDVDVKALGKIANFYVKIQMSDGNGGILDLSSVGLANEFDLCNPGQYKDGLIGLNLPVEDSVKGKTEMKFDISSFMSLLVIYNGNHTFEIDVIDELGQSAKATLKLKVE